MNHRGLSPEAWHEKIQAFHRDLFPRVYALGGKMSGEHGIGYKKRDDFIRCTSKEEVQLIRAIKKAWDPNGIMNPGKIIPLEEA